MYKAKYLLFILAIFSILSITSLFSETKWLIKKNYFRIGEDEKGYRALTDLEITNQDIIILENVPGHRILTFSRDGEYLYYLNSTFGKVLVSSLEGK